MDTVLSADLAYNTANPGSTQTSNTYQFDILNSTGGSFLISGVGGAPDVYVQTIWMGSAAANSQNGDNGSDGFTNWSNSHDGTFAGAETYGYTFNFFEADGVTPFSMNALGTYVNDWGTCCAMNNPTPDGGTANASEVYLRFGVSDPLLLGGISSTIGRTEHFIGAINDTNFFNSVTVIATGNGEYFGVGGFLTFSSVALNSVPGGSSVVAGAGLESPTASIPDIDTDNTYYTDSQLGASQVNPNFVGGTLRFGSDIAVGTDFTVQSQGGTVDTEGNHVAIGGGFTGVGGINKTGSGVLTLSGVNTQSGGFTVSDGTLNAAADTNLGGGALTIGNATFQVSNGFSTTRQMIVQHNLSRVDVQGNVLDWQGEVSGTGGLNLMGSGELVLGASNTFTGATRVGAGSTLVVQSAGALGATGGVELTGDALGTADGNSAALRFETGTELGANFTLTGGALINTASGTTILTGNIADGTGAGQLVKQGNATLVLAGANSYTGGTSVLGGRLVGSSNSLQGDIANEAIVEFSQSLNGTYADVMSGRGGLVKSGAGVLTLTGSQTYTGGTAVLGGTLAGSTGSLRGNITNNAVVEFLQSVDGTYAGSMIGSGALRKSGQGSLTLTGTSLLLGNSYVDSGALDLQGVLGTQLLTIGNGASLVGTGFVDGGVLVQDGGRLSPGNSPGTVYVSGDVTLSDGSLFVTEIDGRTYSLSGGAGSYDRLVLTGTDATFTANGTISPILRSISGAANNDFDPVVGDMFTVVLADNIAGTFDSILQPADGLPVNTRFDVIYNENSVQLALVAYSFSMMAEDLGWKGNPSYVGYAFDMASGYGASPVGELSDLYEAFHGMTPTELETTFRSLSGDIHAHVLQSTETALANADDMVLSAALGRGTLNGSDDRLKDGLNVWSRVEARKSSLDPDRRTEGFDEDIYGVTMGANLVNKPRTRLGVAMSYKTLDLYTKSADAATNHMTSVYAYGSRGITQKFTLSGLVGLTAASSKTRRQTVLPTQVIASRSKEDYLIAHAEIEGRYAVATRGDTSLYAIGGLRTANFKMGGHGERGSVDYTQLSLPGESRSTYQTKLGAELVRKVGKNDLALFTHWVRDIGDDPTVTRSVKLSNAVWETTSVNRGLDTFKYGMTAHRALTERLSFDVEFTGAYNSPNYDSQQVSLGLNWVW